MAGVSLSALSITSIPKITAKSEQYTNRIKVSSSNEICSTSISFGGIRYKSYNNNGCSRKEMRRLNAAGLTDIEPDLNEDPVDRWENSGISNVCFLLQ